MISRRGLILASPALILSAKAAFALTPAQQAVLFTAAPVAAAVPTSWDPLKANVAILFATANRQVSLAGNVFYATVLSVKSRTFGKAYVEQTITAFAGDGQTFGFCNIAQDLTQRMSVTNNSLGWGRAGGVSLANSSIAPGVQGWGLGDTLGMAIDFGAQKVWCRTTANTVWNNDAGADPVAGTNGVSFAGMAAGPYFLGTTLEIGGDTYLTNFGSVAFAMAQPAGYGIY